MQTPILLTSHTQVLDPSPDAPAISLMSSPCGLLFHYTLSHCLQIELHTAILYNIGEEPAYLIKGTKYPLVLEDVQSVYQGKWLNDQVMAI